ncbi:MAG: ABC transporter substrate-binding protein [Chloroflexi bacterium]|nr:ABC transporter substrate-binding protein [Chloroflexota bacterium]
MGFPSHLRFGLSTLAILGALLATAACEGEKVVETVVVEKVVEKPVQQTVVVEKPVEKTVVVEKEKVVEKTVVVEKEKIVVQTAAAQPTATATPLPKPVGKFVLADARIVPPIYVHALAGTGFEWKNIGWGIGDNLMRVDEKNKYLPEKSIAESFTVAPDQSSITFKIRKGVKFHGGGQWGEVTADDVAWSFNNAMREGSLFYRVASLQPYMKGMAVIDPQTVRLDWKSGKFLPWWDLNFTQVRSADPWITSKKIVDQLGEQKASETPIATGPFEVIKWASGERIELKAVVPHWRGTPQVEGYTVIEMREPLAMAAAFKTGEVDFAPIPNNILLPTINKVAGSRRIPVGFPQAACVNFTGNYWAQKDKDGKQVFPRPGFHPEHPWVGDPRDPADMEQARKVRLALATAIDRDVILEKVFANLGFTQAVEAGIGFGPESSAWKKEWEFKYDPNGAKKLLADAGFPSGFTLPFYVPPDQPRVNPEAGQSVAQYWRDIGVKVEIDSTAYAARRPKRFGGVDDVPWYHCGTIYTGEDAPYDGGMGPDSTFRGMEVENELYQLYFDNFKEPSREKRIANNVKFADYVTKWVLQTVFSVVDTHYAVGPRVEAWSPHEIDAPIFTAPETVRVKR